MDFFWEKQMVERSARRIYDFSGKRAIIEINGPKEFPEKRKALISSTPFFWKMGSKWKGEWAL